MIELAGLKQFPQQVRELFDGFSRLQVTAKPTPEEFSLAEHVCHLRDIEIEGYLLRIRRILHEESPRLNDIDGTPLAIERDYNREDVVKAWEGFSKARNASIELLAQVDESQLYRKAELEGVGEITLCKLVEMMHEHDESHLEEMTTLRRRLLNFISN